MLIHSLLTTNADLDNTISSYGLFEEFNQNTTYLRDYIQLAQATSNSPVNYISILDSEKQYVISSDGLSDFPLQRRESICQFTIKNNEPTIIHNLKGHKDTANLEVSQGNFTYYAGFPLINNEGLAIGALCVMDVKPDSLDPSQINSLELISNIIVQLLDARRQLIRLIKEINKNFKPAACSDLHCLSGELAHLQNEVINTKNELATQKDKLRISNNDLTQFAHRIAHDIKAPLRSIKIFSQMIQRGKAQETSQSHTNYFEYINSSITEVDRMVDNILQIADLKGDVQPEKVSISNLIDNIEILLFDDLQSRAVKLIKPAMDVQVFGYKALLKQLFQNIISNGIKYSDKNKDAFVKVTFELLEKDVLVKIMDNGIGISMEDIKTVLLPFKRASNHSPVEGYGIGLDTCKVIVDDMGKQLDLESELGSGTTVSFEIPLG
jgi:signal transduction histidine kinase